MEHRGKVQVDLPDTNAMCRQRMAGFPKSFGRFQQGLARMQPMRKHVPPSADSSSMQATFRPSCAARIAAM